MDRMTEPRVRIADTDEKIAACFPVLHELRPHLKDAADLVARVKRMQAEGFIIAYVEEAGRPVACMGVRACEMLHRGPGYYVDDLVTLPDVRSKGYGAVLLDWLETKAQGEGRLAIHLDSGTQRTQAHKFYFRQGYVAAAFHFPRLSRSDLP